MAIAVGAACKAGRYRTYKAVNVADNPIVSAKCNIADITFDLGGGTNVWNSTSSKVLATPPPQYPATLGGTGTVRFLGFEPKPGAVMVFR